MVSLAATIAFLRRRGLDALVDAYGVHSYPSIGRPGNLAAAAQRGARLNSVDLAACRATGTAGGKPCWITEWGFPNADPSCPVNHSGRTLLVDGLQTILPWRPPSIAWRASTTSPGTPIRRAARPIVIVSIGALTESGREAIAAGR